MNRYQNTQQILPNQDFDKKNAKDLASINGKRFVGPLYVRWWDLLE